MTTQETNTNPVLDECEATQPVQMDISDQSSDDQPRATQIEALLMSSERALGEAKLGDLLEITGEGRNKTIRAAIDELNEQYEKTSRSFRAVRLAGGWQLLTTPQFGSLISKLHQSREQHRLSQPALETLSIIAYRQPIMRAEIEAIRGVACGEVLRGLLERRFIRVAGRAEELGRPMLYGTTPQFLKVFGLAALDDLPAVEGLNQPQQPRQPKEPDPAQSESTD